MARFPACFISHGGGPWRRIANLRHSLATLETPLAHMPVVIGETPPPIP